MLETLESLLVPGATTVGRDVEVVTGRLLHAADALWVLRPLLAPLLSLYLPLRRQGRLRQRVAVPASLRPALQLVREVIAVNPGRSFPRRFDGERDLSVWCDASTTGFGAVLRLGRRGGVEASFYGTWAAALGPGDMPVAELAVAVMAVEVWGSRLRNRIVEVHSDSSAAVKALRKGRSDSERMNALLHHALRLSALLDFAIYPQHCPARFNHLADRLSRMSQSSSRQRTASMARLRQPPRRQICPWTIWQVL